MVIRCTGSLDKNDGIPRKVVFDSTRTGSRVSGSWSYNVGNSDEVSSTVGVETYLPCSVSIIIEGVTVQIPS